MNVLGYTEGGMIRVEIDGCVSYVPDDMSSPLRQQIAEWEDQGNTIPPYNPPQPAPTMPTPRLVANALMTVDSGDLGGVSSSAGLSFGMYMGVGLYWLFFSGEMADLSYSYAVSTSQGRATVTDRQLSYMELTVVDDAGAPIDPDEISLQLYRSN